MPFRNVTVLPPQSIADHVHADLVVDVKKPGQRRDRFTLAFAVTTARAADQIL